MFEVLPESTGSCIGFRVSGKVTDKDYDGLLPDLDGCEVCLAEMSVPERTRPK